MPIITLCDDPDASDTKALKDFSHVRIGKNKFSPHHTSSTSSDARNPNRPTIPLSMQDLVCKACWSVNSPLRGLTCAIGVSAKH